MQPRFWCHLKPFDASSEVRLRSSPGSIHDAVTAAPFNHDVHYRGFWPKQLMAVEASSCKAAPEGLPPSLAQHDACASS